MKIVIDSNRAIAALIKDSTTREVLFDEYFEFFAPDYIMTEIHKHENHIVKVAEITKEEFETLISLIFEPIKLIPQTEYNEFLEKYKSVIQDEKDVPYIAVCFACNAEGVWTHDPHFLEQKIIKVFTNIDMLRM